MQTSAKTRADGAGWDGRPAPRSRLSGSFTGRGKVSPEGGGQEGLGPHFLGAAAGTQGPGALGMLGHAACPRSSPVKGCCKASEGFRTEGEVSGVRAAQLDSLLPLSFASENPCPVKIC